MKKRIFAFLLCTAMAFLPSVGCGQDTKAEISDVSAVSEVSTGFDIETARKNISVNNEKIELPVKLSKFGKGWNYDIIDVDNDNYGCAAMDYNGEEIFTGTLAECKKGKEKNSVLYNLTIKTDKSSIDGFTPGISSKDDVIKRYGEPSESRLFNDNTVEVYRYGKFTDSEFGSYVLKSRCMNFTINKTGLLKN